MQLIHFIIFIFKISLLYQKKSLKYLILSNNYAGRLGEHCVLQFIDFHTFGFYIFKKKNFQVNENISVCNIHLPDSENFDGCNDIQLNVGFGYVAHLVQMTAYFLNIPLRYPINHFGSRSKIIDHISLDIQDRERM